MSRAKRESRPAGHRTASFSLEDDSYCIQLHRRRAASQRLPVLDCGRSDPWHYEQPTAANCSTALNSSASDYEFAVAHLLEHGLLPAPNPDGLRAMWRRGGSSRQAAAVIARAWEMVA